MSIKGRAETPEAKRMVVDRILRAWETSPSERLGQFIANANSAARDTSDPFYTEDFALVEACELYARGERR